MLKKIAYLGGFILISVICYSLIKQVVDSLQAGGRVDTETQKVLSLQKQNSELKSKMKQVNSVEFIESQARDRLNFSRAGETVVIISQDEINKVLGTMIEKKEEIIPNWQGWLRLFFK
ncbi:MAG: septum formation initiator family protein [Candidatus Daviesbacteria bacterium]|nr:septum formation initiator family protein [Candidatus Daviesbacteria bacterium]